MIILKNRRAFREGGRGGRLVLEKPTGVFFWIESVLFDVKRPVGCDGSVGTGYNKSMRPLLETKNGWSNRAAGPNDRSVREGGERKLSAQLNNAGVVDVPQQSIGKDIDVESLGQEHINLVFALGR